MALFNEPRSSTSPTKAEFSFRTKCNYLDAIMRGVRSAHGRVWMDGITQHMAGSIRRYEGMPRKRLSEAARQALMNGWNTEFLLNYPLDHDNLIPAANHWAVVQAYYSVYSISRGWLLTETGNAAPTHRDHLHDLGNRLPSASYFPYPLNLSCDAIVPAVRVGGFGNSFSRVPRFNALHPPADDYEQFLYTALTTTRRDRLDHLRTEQLEKNKSQQRLSRKTKLHHESRIGRTTLLDLLYRMRLLANYGDAESFTSPGLSASDAERFLTNLVSLVSVFNFVFETLIAARAGGDALRSITPRLLRDAPPREWDLAQRMLRWAG